MRRTSLFFLLLLSLVQGRAVAGDAYRGATLLEKNKCTECHSIRGQGGKLAPDLGTRGSRQYTPAVMASVMWNHAPKMWSAMAAHGIERANFSERDAADLFAYFYSVRFFEHPGNVEHGKRVFVEDHCVECHALSAGATGIGKPVRGWTAISDPIVLVNAMWNHSLLMKRALTAKQFKWVTLNAQDLADLSAYLRNLPQGQRAPANFWLPGPEQGAVLFRAKGCEGCHEGGDSPEYQMSNQTLTGIAAAMWNHSPRIADPPAISVDEMRQIIAYVWEKQSLGAAGNVERGKQTFADKNCAGCHNDAKSGAPHLGKGAQDVGKAEQPYAPITMVSVLWKHGPAMLEQMRRKNVPWPNLSPSELSDVTAYLNARR